jgi:hypothetical protein
MANTPDTSAKHRRIVVGVGVAVFLALLAGFAYEVGSLLLLRSRGIETTVKVTRAAYAHRVKREGLTGSRRNSDVVIISTDDGFKSGGHWYSGVLDEDDELRVFNFGQPVTVGIRYPIVREPALVRTYDGGFYVGRKTDSLWTIYGNTYGAVGLVSWLGVLAVIPGVVALLAHGILTELLPRMRAERAALRPQSIGSLLKDD